MLTYLQNYFWQVVVLQKLQLCIYFWWKIFLCDHKQNAIRIGSVVFNNCSLTIGIHAIVQCNMFMCAYVQKNSSEKNFSTLPVDCYISKLVLKIKNFQSEYFCDMWAFVNICKTAHLTKQRCIVYCYMCSRSWRGKLDCLHAFWHYFLWQSCEYGIGPPLPP